MKFARAFINKLRLSNPWNYKAPFLISIPYFMVLAGAVPPWKALFFIVLSYSTIIGIAGFGYFTNDWADIEKDKAAGKPNGMSELNTLQRIAALVILLALALLPWIWFPLDKWSGILLAAEFLLFMLYAFPPFRLKERGFAGVLTDALYAHVVPAGLAAYTFYLVGEKTYNGFFVYLLFLSAWQLVLGIRNILLHQLKDYDADKASGTRTMVTYTGIRPAEIAVRWILLPLESILFFFFLVMISMRIPFLIYVWMGFLLLMTVKLMLKKTLPADYRQLAYTFFDDFYLDWFAVLVLIGMLLYDVRYLPLLFLHIVLYRNILKKWSIAVFQKLKR